MRWGVEAFGLPIHDNWWQTETGGIMIANTAAADIRPGSMGRPLPGITVGILRRDEHGHVQRLGPAVLATWDQEHDRFEHFGWGVTPELALRIGSKAGDLEVEIDRRRDYLDGLVTAGLTGIDDVRTAIAGYRSSATADVTPATRGSA